jgi:hypothetical protein
MELNDRYYKVAMERIAKEQHRLEVYMPVLEARKHEQDRLG